VRPRASALPSLAGLDLVKRQWFHLARLSVTLRRDPGE
jgi:hypothetical protein